MVKNDASLNVEKNGWTEWKPQQRDREYKEGIKKSYNQAEEFTRGTKHQREGQITQLEDKTMELSQSCNMKEELKKNRDFWNNNDQDNIYITIGVPERKVRKRVRNII